MKKINGVDSIVYRLKGANGEVLEFVIRGGMLVDPDELQKTGNLKNINSQVENLFNLSKVMGGEIKLLDDIEWAIDKPLWKPTPKEVKSWNYEQFWRAMLDRILVSKSHKFDVDSVNENVTLLPSAKEKLDTYEVHIQNSLNSHKQYEMAALGHFTAWTRTIILTLIGCTSIMITYALGSVQGLIPLTILAILLSFAIWNLYEAMELREEEEYYRYNIERSFVEDMQNYMKRLIGIKSKQDFDHKVRFDSVRKLIEDINFDEKYEANFSIPNPPSVSKHQGLFNRRNYRSKRLKSRNLSGDKYVKAFHYIKWSGLVIIINALSSKSLKIIEIEFNQSNKSWWWIIEYGFIGV